MSWKEDQSPRVQKEGKPALRGKWESAFSWRHMDNVPKETHAVSVMTEQTLETVAKARDEKDDRLLPCPIRRQNRLTVRDKNLQKNQAIKRKALQTKGAKFHADSNFVKTSFASAGILPFVRISSLKKDVYMATNASSDKLRQKESRTRSQRKVVQKDHLPYWRSPYNCVVHLKILIRENLFYVNLENWDRSTPSNSPKAPKFLSFFFSGWIIQKCALREHSPCAPQFRERSHEEALHQEGCARKAAWIWQKKYQAQEFGQNYILHSYCSEGHAGTHFNETKGERIRSRFRSISAHDEQKRIMLRRVGHSEKVQNPFCGVDCQWTSAHPWGGRCSFMI